MVKLADTLDLGSNAERCRGSSPLICTKERYRVIKVKVRVYGVQGVDTHKKTR